MRVKRGRGNSIACFGRATKIEKQLRKGEKMAKNVENSGCAGLSEAQVYAKPVC